MAMREFGASRIPSDCVNTLCMNKRRKQKAEKKKTDSVTSGSVAGSPPVESVSALPLTSAGLEREEALRRELLELKTRFTGVLRRAKVRIQELSDRVAVLKDDAIDSTLLLEKAQAELKKLRQEVVAAAAVKAPAQEIKDVWHIRQSNGATYGPVDFPVLYEWTAEFRVASDDQISRDGKTWIKACYLPALHMEWRVLVSPKNTLGPVNLLALRHLVEQHAVSPDTMVEHVATGERWSVEQLRLPDLVRLVDQNARLKRLVPARPHCHNDNKDTGGGHAPAPPKHLVQDIRRRTR